MTTKKGLGIGYRRRKTVRRELTVERGIIMSTGKARRLKPRRCKQVEMFFCSHPSFKDSDNIVFSVLFRLEPDFSDKECKHFGGLGV